MNDDFFKFLVAIDQLDEFLGNSKQDEELETLEEDNDDSSSN